MDRAPGGDRRQAPRAATLVDFKQNMARIKISMGRPKHRKADRKDEMIRVLVTTDQKKQLTAAADAAGLSVSSWLLSLGLREVQA
jgi:hypothetical protein